MTNGPRTVAGMLVVVAALLAIRGLPFAEASIPAGTNTCPEDIDNDGVVAVPDLLALLGAWGPCSSPRIVDAAASAGSGSNFLVRIWSDGFAEYRAAWDTPLQQPQQWTPLPDNPQAPLSTPVAVSAAENPLTVYRQWADGTADWIEILSFPPQFLPDPAGWQTEPQ
ncbi:MAG: hypothetical protein IH888_07025 [Planctomycetes bacterium]|nr:hypothetical protein [Planctomycetota bacterium]